MTKSVYIRPMFKEDWVAASQIYRQGIETKMATFETNVPKWKRFKRSHIISSCLVAQKQDDVVGFASLSSVSNREVYSGVAEVSVYVDPLHKRNGIGQALLETLIRQSEDQGFWTLQASIFSNNLASIELHKKCGFRVIGVREKVAKRDGEWYDNTILEKRSDKF